MKIGKNEGVSVWARNNTRARERQAEALTNHAETSEKAIEKHLRRRMACLGLPCLKYSNPGESGYPDRLVCLPDGMVLWAELKSRGKSPTRMQRLRHAELRRLGHKVVILDSRAAVDELADKIMEGAER